MPLAARVGDLARCPSCSHGCPSCGHEAIGEAKVGSPDAFINNHAAIRVGDTGVHSDQTCCGDNKWTALAGSPSVFINGKPLMRVGDATKHCGGEGEIIEGSPNVFVGNHAGGPAKEEPHDRTVKLSITDGVGRPMKKVSVQVTCPHREHPVQVVAGNATLSGLCRSASVGVVKTLQTSTWDAHATNNIALPQSHAITPAPSALAPNAPKPLALTSAPAAGATPAPSAPPPKPVAPTAAPAPPGSGAAPGSGASPAGSPPADATRSVAAPASPTSDLQTAHITRPEDGAAVVQLLTVHNWVENVFKVFGQALPTKPGEMAILGVRESSLTGKGTVEQLEKSAAEGKVDEVDFSRTTRAEKLTTATTFNDLLFVVYSDKDVADSQYVDVYECTIDAGKASSNPLGLSILLEGKMYYGKPGSHITSKYSGNDIALHLSSGTAGKIKLAREATKKYHLLSDIKSVGADGTFAKTEDNGTIHMHFGTTSENVGGWSEGCTVLRHPLFKSSDKPPRKPDPKATRYQHFRDTFNGATNKSKIPYLVVSSKYTRSYEEWVEEAKKTQPATPKPKSVILVDKLETPKAIAELSLPSVASDALAERYLPSIATKAFADAVLAEATLLEADAVQLKKDASAAGKKAPPALAGTKAAKAKKMRASLDLILMKLDLD